MAQLLIAVSNVIYRFKQWTKVAYSAMISTPKKRFVIVLRAMHSLSFADSLIFGMGAPGFPLPLKEWRK
jgi:hypothetical protein